MASPLSISALKSNDIMMDVIRAANPERERSAVKRLEQLNENQAFATFLTRPSSEASWSSTAANMKPAHRQNDQRSVGEKFEAMMLSSLIENMFASQSSTSFGSGVAGSSFKSLFAEQMANQMVRSGGLGITSLVDKHKESILNRVGNV